PAAASRRSSRRRRGRRRRRSLMRWRRAGAGSLRLTLRLLFRSAVRTDFAAARTLGDDHRRPLRVGSGARQLHCRQRGRRKQQDAKFAHVNCFPETFFLKHGVINSYALGWIVAGFKFARRFIST
ncbi:MAG: hypothetical protein E6676_36095, partial [Bradyrhizobium sp.]|nr:hypothetical protein [Bradyrhizobium sp.]